MKRADVFHICVGSCVGVGQGEGCVWVCSQRLPSGAHVSRHSPVHTHGRGGTSVAWVSFSVAVAAAACQLLHLRAVRQSRRVQAAGSVQTGRQCATVKTLRRLLSAWRRALESVRDLVLDSLVEAVAVTDGQVPGRGRGVRQREAAGLQGGHMLAAAGPQLGAVRGGRRVWALQEPSGLPHESLLHVREHVVGQDLVQVVQCILPLVVLPHERVLPVPQLRLLDFKPLHPSVLDIPHNLLQRLHHGVRRQVPGDGRLVGGLGLARHAEQGVAVPEGLLQGRLRVFQIQGFRCRRERLWTGFLGAGVNGMVLSVQGPQHGGGVQAILRSGFARAGSNWIGRPGHGEGLHPGVVQGALAGGQVEGKLPSPLEQVLLSFLVPTGEKKKARQLCSALIAPVASWECAGDSRDSFLTSNDEVGSPVLKHHPGRGLNPQPLACFGQQPEVSEAAVSCLYHWKQDRVEQCVCVCVKCVWLTG